MRFFWMWLIWSIGGILDLSLVTWNFRVKRGRKLLEIFYGIAIPFIAVWKLYLIFQGKSIDGLLLLLVLFLVLGIWKITEAKPGQVLVAIAFLYIGGAGSELVSLVIIQSIIGIPVLPFGEAQGAMACMMMANGLLLFYLMMGNWFWKQYGQEKRLNRDFLLFFLVLVQTVFLFWIVYAGYREYIHITISFLAGAVTVVFGTISFSFVQIHDEEMREEEKRLKKMEIQSQKEYEKYRELEEVGRMLHQIRHDFNNQLSTVYYLSKAGKMKQAEELLDEMEQLLKDKEEKESDVNFEERDIGEAIEKPIEKAFPEKGYPFDAVFLLPLGQFLFLPAILQILAVHWGHWPIIIDAGIIFLVAAADGLWLFLFFGQQRREKRIEQLLTDICRQQTEQSREEVLREGIRERRELRKELLSCLNNARNTVRITREPSVFREFLEEVQKRENIRHCDNVLVNTVLQEKQRECRSFDILFSTQVEIPEFLEIKSSHLCSIFTNLLDNAIHACQNLSKDKRQIAVQSKKQGDYLYIRVSNFTNEEYRKRPKLPGHGLGKQIIARLAQEYQGEYWVKENGETYIAAVVLQIYGKSKTALK